MIKASVIGWPISHSRSPLIHGYWLNQFGIDGTYTREPVPPEQLADFIDRLRKGDHVGTNVTLPHKEAAVAFVDEPDDRVRRIGALNTIWREGGKLHATSTDGPGFVANLKHTLPQHELAARPVTIIGAGGSTRALIDELLREGVSRIHLHNRTHARAESLAKHFGPSVVPVQTADLPKAMADTGLLINTTSAGMNGSQPLDLPWQSLHPEAVAADIVYTPLITDFLKQAQSRGHDIVPGLGMLLHQAVVGFEKWFGARPVVTKELHDLVARDIDPGYKP